MIQYSDNSSSLYNSFDLSEKISRIGNHEITQFITKATTKYLHEK